jgi:hypothetical protein
MEFDVLPGPPLAELARTVLARAVAATVTCEGSRSIPPMTVPVRSDGAGQPVLRPPAGSPLERHVTGGPVTVAVPAAAPFSALRLAGAVRPGGAPADGASAQPRAGYRAGYLVTVRSAEFSGPVPVPVPLAEYAAAAPDPLWRAAPAALRHLEDCHVAELVGCVRAHGLIEAEYVVPVSLDRFGLGLLVLMSSGTAAVRLAFPSGPVATMREVPSSIHAVMICQCAGRSRHLGRSGDGG